MKKMPMCPKVLDESTGDGSARCSEKLFPGDFVDIAIDPIRMTVTMTPQVSNGGITDKSTRSPSRG